MKRVINVVLISIAVLTIAGVTDIVRAQQKNEQANENSQETSDYALPYPGVLPDSSLYSLKMARDKIISFFISDPLKKAEFNLLMADKRVNSGLYLADKGNFSLAESTISKGQNYLDMSVKIVEEEVARKNDMKPIIDHLKRAIKKHEEVFTSLVKKSPENLKPAFRNTLEKARQVEEKIKKLEGKNV